MLGRIIFGNDSPSGSGIMALGILRNIAYAACMSGVTGAEAVCMGSGNTACVMSSIPVVLHQEKRLI